MQKTNEISDWLTFEVYTDQKFNQYTQKKLSKKQFKQEYKKTNQLNFNTFNN